MPAAALLKRRDLLVVAAGVTVGRGTVARAVGFRAATARPRLAVVGCGARWDKRVTDPTGNYGVGKEFRKFADIVTICDVDAERLDRAREMVKGWQGSAPAATGDYRKVIDDAAIDAVHISAPDHWHAKIAIEAVRAGKDVSCRKPRTLTIDEGKRLREAVRATGRIVQVGTQQRSDMRFITAVALVQAGRLGRLTRIQCAVGEGWARGHYEFRWWYDYSGGKLTDWGRITRTSPPGPLARPRRGRSRSSRSWSGIPCRSSMAGPPPRIAPPRRPPRSAVHPGRSRRLGLVSPAAGASSAPSTPSGPGRRE